MQPHTALMTQVFSGPLEKIQERNRQAYHGFPALIPEMTPELEHACLAEIRSMRHYLTPWKKMPNGMVAGQFAFLYLHHFKERRRKPSTPRAEDAAVVNNMSMK